MIQSQRHISGLRFNNISDAETSGRTIEVCYVFETKTFYEFLENAPTLIINHTTVLSTGVGNNTRWRAVAGKYEIGKFARPITDIAQETVFKDNELPELQFDINGNVMMELVEYGDI